MLFGIIFTRILFIACMVFIIGYVFGGFSKKPVLTKITKVATILAIVLFVIGNVFLFRVGPWRNGYANGHGKPAHCWVSQQDSVRVAPHQ